MKEVDFAVTTRFRHGKSGEKRLERKVHHPGRRNAGLVPAGWLSFPATREGRVFLSWGDLGSGPVRSGRRRFLFDPDDPFGGEAHGPGALQEAFQKFGG